MVVIRTNKELKNHKPNFTEEDDGVVMFTYMFSSSQIHEINEIGNIIELKVH